MNNELIALVDEDDKIIGYGDEEEVHKNGTLHQAVTLLLVTSHWGNDIILLDRLEDLWTSSCHTHIKEGEQLLDTVIRIARETLNRDIPENDYTSDYRSLYKIGIFQYCKKSGSCIDREINHVFLYWLHDEPLKEELVFMPHIWECNEENWNKKDQSMHWLDAFDLYDLREWMVTKPALFDTRFFMVFGLFLREWMLGDTIFWAIWSDEWDEIMCKKNAEISVREIATCSSECCKS